MGIVYWIILHLLVLAGYLYLNRYIAKKGNTSPKYVAFRIAIWVHGATLVLKVFSAILFHQGIFIFWGLNWYMLCLLLLSGIIVYLTIPKKIIGYLWGKLYFGIYYWGIAICIPFWPLVLMIVGFCSSYNIVLEFQNQQFSIYNTTTIPVAPEYREYVIYENMGVFKKKLTTFHYDGWIREIRDVVASGDTVLVTLARQANGLEEAKDTTLIINNRLTSE